MTALALLLAVLAAEPNRYPLDVLRVVDGDTLVATIHLGYSVALDEQHIRIVGFDAWEKTSGRFPVTIEEKTKGAEASRALDKLLKDAKQITLQPAGVERDAYGRVLGKLFADGANVGDWMTAHGYARVRR